MSTIILLAVLGCGSSRPAEIPDPSDAEAPAEGPSAADAKAFVDTTEAELLALWMAWEGAAWEHATDLTDEKEKLSSEAEEAVMAYLSKAIPDAALYDGVEGLDEDTARKLAIIKRSTSLPAPADATKRAELAAISSRLGAAYGKGKHCTDPADESTCRDLGDLEGVLLESRDPKVQQEAWEAWRTVSPAMRSDYQRFVELGNEGAREIGYADVGALWRSGYDMPADEVPKEVERLWGQMQPLYEQLHCYVRAELNSKYGDEVVPKEGAIPAHLLGNMWAQDWAYLYPVLEPYKGHSSLDVDKALEEQDWDAIKMVKTSEGFFTSMGLDPMPETFWERSMFTKPDDREVVCHASAWDVEWNDDQRIKMCIRPLYEDLTTIHHELGHNYYNHYYVGLSPLYRSGAHDGFHEAIGDSVVLSMTPGYLAQIGLVPEAKADENSTVNVQMQRALSNVAFLPFGLVVDSWRWEVFDGSIPPDAYNAGWWRLRKELQGVAPPAVRGEDHFDPGAKYHIPGNTPYLRYFFAQVLQFQLYKSMCEASGHEGPLHTCNLYGSKEAGAKLETLLSMGSSKPWPDALEAATGNRQMDAGPLVEYFTPLNTWLVKENEGRTCGW